MGKRAWYLFIRHRNKRKAIKVGTDKARGLALKKEMEDRLARADLHLGPTPSTTPSPTIQAYAEHYLTTAAPSLKRSTVRFYRDCIKNHIVPAIGVVPVAELSRAHVKSLIEALQAKDLSSKTMDGVVRTLSTIASEAVEDGLLTGNPVLRPGRLRRKLRDPNALTTRPIDPFTREEVEQILAAAYESRMPARQANQSHEAIWFVWTQVAARTGIRVAEQRALQWGSIDWRHRFVMIDRSYVEGHFTSPKNGKARRVYLGREVWRVLRWWRRQQRAHWCSAGSDYPISCSPRPTVRRSKTRTSGRRCWPSSRNPTSAGGAACCMCFGTRTPR